MARFKINLQSVEKFKSKMILRESVMLVKIVWMRYYQWQKGDTPFGGESYLRNMTWTDGVANISENQNFIDFDGKCLGAFETKGRLPRVDKIDGAPSGAESVDDVLVIFCAPNPEREGKGETNVIGWYADATVYRDYQEDEEFNLRYNICAYSKNCVLLPETERKDNKIWRLPQNSGSAINFGQSMYKFPKNSTPELQDVLREIASYDRENWCDKI